MTFGDYRKVCNRTAGALCRTNAMIASLPLDCWNALSRGLPMNKLVATALFASLAFALPVTNAGAVGCISGAIAGGVAGHYAGHHGILGAAGGCIAGHELHKKQKAAQRLKQQQMQQQQNANATQQ